MLDYTWTCKCCGQQQNGLPLDWIAEAPDNYFWVPEPERDERTMLSDDFCHVDGQHYLRGVVEIPIIGRSEVLAWGAWVSLSDASFRRVRDVWNQPGEEAAGPFFGWFSVRLPLYPDTYNLKSNVHLRANGNAPFIKLEPTDHRLAVEQREGVTLDRVVDIAEALLPRH